MRTRGSLAACIILFSAVSVAQTGPVQYVYDQLGRLAAVIDANGNAAAYSYDAVGNILSIARFSSTQVSVLSFTPSQGTQETSVTIYGTGFSPTAAQNAVQFNGVAAVVTSSTSNQLVTSVPAGATSGPITVTAPLGTTASSSSFVVSASSGVPTITSITPPIAPVGNAMAINGTNFNTIPANNRLRFNSVASAVPTSTTATTIATTVPSGTGSGKITLDTPSGTAVSPNDFFIPFNGHTVADVGYTGRTTIGTTQNVTLAANKIAILVFDATAEQRVSVLLNGSTFTSSTLYLFLPSGTVLTESVSGALASTLLPATGTYAIGIETSSGGSAGVQLISDVTGTITIDGAPVTTNTVLGQDVRLTFNANAGRQIVLTVTNVTNPSATVELLGSTGQAQGSFLTISNSPAGQLFFMDQRTLPATGTYTLWIQHFGTNIGSETLQLNSAQDFVAPITPGGPAVRVPATGETIIGQNGRLTFTGVAGHRVSMNISNTTYTYTACQVTLKDPSYSYVTSGNCGSGGNTFIDSVTLNAAGTYTVFVDPQGRATGHATVQLNDASDVTGTIAIDGAPVTETTTVQGQDARLSFTATAGQRIVVYATNVTTPFAYVYLVKPDGTNQTYLSTNNSPAGQTFFLGTQTLATTGTYQLWVQHYSTDVGSETLQIASVPADFTATVTVGGAAVTVPTSGNTAVGQAAKLTFGGTAGQQVTINVTSPTFGSSYPSCLLAVKDPSNNSVTSGYCGTGAAATIGPFTTSVAGTYAISISPQGMATGSVTISLVTP